MKKIALFFCIVLGGTLLALDLTDIPNEAGISKIKEVVNANNALTEAAVPDKTTTATISGNWTYSGNNTFSGFNGFTATAANVTNGQTITAAVNNYTLNGIGGAANSTNTIILGTASAANKLLILTLSADSTNLVLITDSAPVYSSGTVMGPGDSQVFISVSTNWYQIGGSNN